MTALAAFSTPDTRQRIVHITYIAGIAGVVIIALAMLITALGYQGVADEPYSPLNHFVSELGEVSVSELALVFNIGLILGGGCFVVFILGVAAFMGNWYGILFGLVGVLMGINGALVGVFPMDDLETHIPVALNFFNLGLGSMLLFSLYVILFRKRDLPLWLLIPALLTGVIFFAFLYLTPPIAVSESGDILATTREFVANRPDVAQIAIMEWAVIVAILGWVVVVSLYLRSWANRPASRTAQG